MNALDLTEIEKRTFEYCEGWGLAHAQRLVHLIERIGVHLQYDHQALLLAVYLHDWGAYPRFSQPGVEHALRSRQVAEREILPHLDLSPSTRALVLEAIELHDYRDPRPAPSNEALLLREADFLDFLGAIGVAREFARGGKDLQKSYKQIISRKANIMGRFTLPVSKAMANARIARMEAFMKALMDESFGCL